MPEFCLQMFLKNTWIRRTFVYKEQFFIMEREEKRKLLKVKWNKFSKHNQTWDKRRKKKMWFEGNQSFRICSVVPDNLWTTALQHQSFNKSDVPNWHER